MDTGLALIFVFILVLTGVYVFYIHTRSQAWLVVAKRLKGKWVEEAEKPTVRYEIAGCQATFVEIGKLLKNDTDKNFIQATFKLPKPSAFQAVFRGALTDKKGKEDSFLNLPFVKTETGDEKFDRIVVTHGTQPDLINTMLNEACRSSLLWIARCQAFVLRDTLIVRGTMPFHTEQIPEFKTSRVADILVHMANKAAIVLYAYLTATEGLETQTVSETCPVCATKTSSGETTTCETCNKIVHTTCHEVMGGCVTF